MALGITSAAKSPQLKEVLSCSALCLAARSIAQTQGCAEHCPNSHYTENAFKGRKRIAAGVSDGYGSCRAVGSHPSAAVCGVTGALGCADRV